jgi:hypothetical protein
VTNISNVVAIAAGFQFSMAVTSNGQVYAWGDNTFGELGTSSNAVASTNRPMLVAGISNAVLVSAPRADDELVVTNFTDDGQPYPYPGGMHSLVMTVDQGTNHYWGFGDNTYGQVGNGTNGGATNLIGQSTPAQVQFCTRCQREVQLGTNGTFTAGCNGTLYLYFNTDNFSGYNAAGGGGSYSARVNGSNATVYATNYLGVAVGTVTIDNVYTFSASGLCVYDYFGHQANPDGNDSVSNNPVACSSLLLNVTNSVCPSLKCFSLVGKIQ